MAQRVDYTNWDPSEGTSRLVREPVTLIESHLGDYFHGVDLADGSHRIFAASVDGTLIGAAVASMMTSADRDGMARRLTGPDAHRVRGADFTLVRALELLADPTSSVGDLYALAVEPSSRTRGVGKQLVVRMLDFMKSAGVSAAFAEAWHNPTEPSSLPIFERLAFSLAGEFERYWMADDKASDEAGERCPMCGVICSCSASVFFTEIIRHE